MRYRGDEDLPTVSDQQFEEARAGMRPYTAVVLKASSRYQPPGPERSPDIAATILRHARRNYALWLAGLLRVVCPIADGSGVAGISIFDASSEDVDRIMREDPAVKDGLFTFDVHPTGTFPQSSLAPSDPA